MIHHRALGTVRLCPVKKVLGRMFSLNPLDRLGQGQRTPEAEAGQTTDA